MAANKKNQPDVAKRAEMTERQERVADMLAQRFTLRQIAAEVGVSLNTVYKDSQVVVEVWKQNMAGSYEEKVAAELAALDHLARKLRRGVEAGDWKCIDQAIKLADRRARLLGLDAPVQTRVNITIEAIDAEIERLEAKAGLPVLEGEIIAEIVDAD